MFDIQKETRRLTMEERRRVVVRSRTLYGAIRLFKQPWTLVFPLLLACFATLAYHNCNKVYLPGNHLLPDWEVLWQLILSILIVVLSLLALWAILVLLGTPRYAKKIDAALAYAGLVDRYGFSPTLLHMQSIKGTAVQRMTFYSKGIALNLWKELEEDISDVLNVHFVEAPTYGGRKGNNRNYIVLTVAPGVGNQPSATLYDDDEL